MNEYMYHLEASDGECLLSSLMGESQILGTCYTPGAMASTWHPFGFLAPGQCWEVGKLLGGSGN